MHSMQHYYFLLAVLAAVAAASAASLLPESKSAKNQRFNSMKSHDELFDSKADKSTISLREQKNLKGHRDLHNFRGLLSGAISDNRSVLSSGYTVSLHVFLPTVLPLMDYHSKNIFELVALEFIVSNIDDENLPIESISNIQITEQDLAWSSIFDYPRTPGIEVFFRAEAVVSGRTSQEAVEQSIQFMFDSKSTLFQEMFDIAKEYPIDGSSASSPAPSIGLPEPSIQPTVLSVGLSDPLTTPPSTLLPGPSTESPASQALSVGPPDLSTVPPRLTQPLAPSAILPDPSTKLSTPSTSASRPGSTFLAVVIISTITGSASFIVILLLISRHVRKARDSNGEKLPLETTMQSEDKEGHDQTKTSFVLEDDDAMIDLHDTTKEQHDREFIVSDEESESVASTLSKDTLAKDYIDTHMYFECDESAIKSSIASSSSSSNSGSTDSYNYSQKSVITLEDLDKFDSELRQSEC